jgi:hypothetical protein
MASLYMEKVMAHGLEIDWDTADRITLAVLGDQLKLLREEIRAKDEDGSYMHPEDYTKAKEKLIPALEVLIPYYGGDIDG